jgi:hypothetical protein
MVMRHETAVLGMALAGALLTARPPQDDGGLFHDLGDLASVHSALAPLSAGPDPSFPDPIHDLFKTSDRCLACHKGVTTSDGLDVSIGLDWRASMMANSARDPYWQAAVRREILDHPDAAEAIEQKCSRCHMPMANVVATADGRPAGVFANLPAGAGGDPAALLAADGVSCAACHQIGAEGLGTEASWTGGFAVSEAMPPDGRPMYGPFEPDSGGVGIMRSATAFRPTEGTHLQSSELCASCHTLFTHALLPGGGEGPEFPEQAPYLEWRASAFAAEDRSCQDCHMPEVAEEVPVTAVLGVPRPNVSRHVFRGGNFFMLRMLNRYREELGVVALPHELQLAAARTEEHLRTSTATLTIEDARSSNGRVELDVVVTNLAGHKFPTAYPSRRAWLRLVVRDRSGRALFESGAFGADGRIAGNDNDADPTRFEPHYDHITEPDQVQVYEAVMADDAGAVTTGLMSAHRWVKENRLLPRGFGESAAAEGRVAVVGSAAADDDFAPGGDRVRYSVAMPDSPGPLTVTAELWFQPIAYRWALNLAGYDSMETDRFVRYYREMAAGSAIVVASSQTVVER